MIKELTSEQMNVIIARFEGRKFYNRFSIDDYGPATCNAYPEMKYHSDWNWLMPVVEKIEIMANVTIRPGICSIEMLFMNKRRYAKEKGIATGEVLPIAEHNDKDFIGNVYNAVYDFIVWYNENNKPQH